MSEHTPPSVPSLAFQPSTIHEHDEESDILAPPCPPFAPSTPKRHSFYRQGNNSSSSLIANTNFSFGGGSNDKYVPQPKLAPPRQRSPARSQTRSPSPARRHQPEGATTRTFRKGHRYKHSSVSMNIFQEPEIIIPLTKELLIPSFRDLTEVFQDYGRVTLVVFQAVLGLVLYHYGHSYPAVGTLAHFIVYDIIATLISLLVKTLTKFESWSTGTLKFPFGLNRLEIVLNFGFAVSLMFVGLDLLFHVLEETIVAWFESGEHNDDIHIAHQHGEIQNFTVWYILCAVSLATSAVSFVVGDKGLRINMPSITIAYSLFLALYPFIGHNEWSTIAVAAMVMFYGWKIAQWNSVLLMLGYSYGEETETTLRMEKLEDIVEKEAIVFQDSITNQISKQPWFRSSYSIENMIISKVSYELYVVVVQVKMKGGSNDDELDLRLGCQRIISAALPHCEITIDITRI